MFYGLSRDPIGNGIIGNKICRIVVDNTTGSLITMYEIQEQLPDVLAIGSVANGLLLAVDRSY